MKKLLLLTLLATSMTPLVSAQDIDQIEEDLVKIELELNDKIDDLYRASNGFILKDLDAKDENEYEDDQAKIEFLSKGRYYIANVYNAWVFEYTNQSDEEVDPFSALENLFTVEISDSQDDKAVNDWTIYPLYEDGDNQMAISKEFNWDKKIQPGASQVFMIIYPKDYLYSYKLLVNDGDLSVDAYVSEYEQ